MAGLLTLHADILMEDTRDLSTIRELMETIQDQSVQGQPLRGQQAQEQASQEPPPLEQPAQAQPTQFVMPTLYCESLTKCYGGVSALNNISLSLAPGRIVGLLGPNGSGKTTLIKLAAGLLQPTSGRILINGVAPSAETKAHVSYLPERPYFTPSMKVHELISFFQDFYVDFDRQLAEAMLADLGVSLAYPLATLSKGTKEKVQLVLVMARRASLYLLDEPIGGVDPGARDYILRTIIGNYHKDATVLISTHLVYDVEQALDDVVLLSNGSVFANTTADQFREQTALSIDEYFRRMFAC